MNQSSMLSWNVGSPPSLADTVYDRLLNAIMDGQFSTGQELSEVGLAAEMGVSRTPIHEAMKRLVSDGLIERMTNRRARVVSLTDRQIREVYDLRLLLEPVAAERAATRLDASDLRLLRDASNRIASTRDHSDWPSRAIDFDIEFHDTLAARCDHDMLHAEITRFRRLVRALCRATGTRDNLEQAFDEHLRILDALEARSPSAARQAMANHIEARRDIVLRELVVCADTVQ